MPYLGNNLQVAYPTYRVIDDVSGSFNGVTTSFALLVGGLAPVPLPLNSQQCLISVGGVVQKPDDSGAEGFRLSGGNIVFSSAPNTGEDFFGVVLAGADYVNAGGAFPDGSVSVPSITFDSDTDTGFYRPSSGTVAITSNSTERVRIDSNGRVGIGTTSPSSPLHIGNQAGVVATPTAIQLDNSYISTPDPQKLKFYFYKTATESYGFGLGSSSDLQYWAGDNITSGQHVFYGGTTASEKMRLTTDNYVRLGSTSGGIQFNGDSAAANALDDYEEGTWTPALYGTGGSPTSVAYSVQNGTYTKVGKLVTCRFYLQFTTFTGGIGTAGISGLPFTAVSTASTFSEYSFPYNAGVTYPAGTTTLGLELAPSTSHVIIYGMGSALSGYQLLTYGTHVVSSATGKLYLAVITYMTA